MDYQEKANDLITNLKMHKYNIHLTDGHKQTITFTFKLSSIPLLKEIPQAEIESQEEYLLITDYIISEVNEPMFNFKFDSREEGDKYLFCVV